MTQTDPTSTARAGSRSPAFARRPKPPGANRAFPETPGAELPAELRSLLAQRGWERLESDDGTWRVTEPTGTSWTVRAVGRAHRPDPHTTERVDVLSSLRHAHVQRVEVVGGYALVEHVPGTDLATLLRSRTSWTVGQVVTLLVPLAQALDTLHRHGVVHGDVAPGNVVVTPDGRPVLVDLLDGAGPEERGTPGVAAPERSAGVVTGAGDVHALAATVKAALDLCDARVVNPWLLGPGEPPGRPQVADRTGPVEGLEACPPGAADRTEHAGVALLATLLGQATDADPEQRPSAARLAAEAWACAAPEPLPDVPGRLLAAATLRRQVAEETLRAPAPPAGRRVPRHRACRRVTPGRVLVGVGVGAAVVVGGVLTVPVGMLPGRTPDGAAAAVGRGQAAVSSSPARPDPLLAALELTRRRALALATGDAEALARVSVPGSAPAAADRVLLSRLAGSGVVPGSVVVDVQEPARLVSAAPALGVATVALAVRVRAETRGATPGHVPTSYVELDVRWFDGEWRVSAVRDGR